MLGFHFLQFDSGVTPLLEGQTLAADSELGSAIDHHYLLPQAADIQYYPAPSFTKQKFQDFIMMLTKDNNEQCDDTDYIPAESYGNMTYMLTEISIIIVISALSVTAWIVIKGQVCMYVDLLYAITNTLTTLRGLLTSLCCTWYKGHFPMSRGW